MRRVSDMARLNSAHICTVAGCSRNRTSLSKYCQRHLANLERNGHPTGGPIEAKRWAPYRSRIREVYQANATHPGLAKALQLLKGWLAEAVEHDGKQHWATEVARVCRHGCSALDVLVELASCWCYLEDQPRVTLSDSHRDWALSKAVLGLAPRARVVTPQAALKGSTGYAPKARPAVLKHIGPHLVRLVGPLLITTHRALRTEEERARAEVEAMRAEFHATPSAIERAAQVAIKKGNE